jgi:hypothetical protein
LDFIVLRTYQNYWMMTGYIRYFKFPTQVLTEEEFNHKTTIIIKKLLCYPDIALPVTPEAKLHPLISQHFNFDTNVNHTSTLSE